MKQKKTKILSLLIALAVFIGFTMPLYPVTSNAAEDDPAILITLGDSYSCGEGITPFYGQDNKVLDNGEVNPDWLAHRSTKAWAGMLELEGVEGNMAQHLGTNWYFVAASGAVIGDLENGQTKKISRNDISATSATLAPQFKVFEGKTLTENDFVTVSIGGNDIGFVDLLVSSITMSDSDFTAKINNLKSDEKTQKILANLKTAYENICDKAGDANVIVVGYPRLIDSNGASVSVPLSGGYSYPASLSGNKAQTLNAAVDWFDDTIKGIVDDLRENQNEKICFVDVRKDEAGDIFNGHEAYTDEPYINGVTFGAGSEDIDQSPAFSVYSFDIYLNSCTFHPNESGMAAYAEAVQKTIDSIIPEATPTPEVTPTPTPEVTPTPTPEVTATPTPEVTPTPTPEVTPTPTPEVTLTPTPEVTPTPDVTPTTEVSPTPEETSTPENTPTSEPTTDPSADPSATPSTVPSAVPSTTPGGDVTPSPSATPTVTPGSTDTDPGVKKDNKTTFKVGKKKVKNKSKISKKKTIKITDKDTIKKITLNGKKIKIKKNKKTFKLKLKKYKKLLKKKGKLNKLVVTDKNGKKVTIKFKTK